MGRGNIAYDQIRDAPSPPDGTLYLAGDGRWTAPAGGGGGGSIPWCQIHDPSSVSFAWRNQGGASVTPRSVSYFMRAPAAAGDNVRGLEISASAPPFSVAAGIVPAITTWAYNVCGIYVTDGTRLILYLVVATGQLLVQEYSTVTAYSSTQSSVTLANQTTPLFLKIVDDGTNLIFSWSVNGYDYTQQYTQARLTWLSSITQMGWFANSNSTVADASVLLVSWLQGID